MMVKAGGSLVPLAAGPIKGRATDAIRREVEVFKEALAAAGGAQEAFICVFAPGWLDHPPPTVPRDGETASATVRHRIQRSLQAKELAPFATHHRLRHPPLGSRYPG